MKKTNSSVRVSNIKEVKDIMNTDIATISPDVTMADALTTMIEKNVGCLIVTKYSTPVGIVTERDLLIKVLAMGKDLRDQKVESIMSYPLNAIAPSAKIKEAAKMMAQKKVRRLAVFDVGRMVGLLTAIDIVKSMPDFEAEAKVDDIMIKRVYHVDEKTPIARVIEIMSGKYIGSIIVTRKGEPFGIFTERNLLSTFIVKGRHGGVYTEEDIVSTYFVKGKPLDVEVGKEATSNLITVPTGTSLQKAAETMVAKHVRNLPIEENGKIVGIITARDLVEAYAK